MEQMANQHRYSEAGRLFSELAHGATAQAQRFEALAKLFAEANQPLPGPIAAPLVGSVNPPDDDLFDDERAMLECIADSKRGNTPDELAVIFGIQHHTCIQILATLASKRLVESFTDDIGVVAYRVAKADDSPDSGEMTCPRNVRCTLGPFHNGECDAPTYGTDWHEPTVPTFAPSADIPPGTELVWQDETGRMVQQSTAPQSTVRPYRDHVHEVGSCVCDTWDRP